MKIMSGWMNELGQTCLMFKENGQKKIIAGNYPWYFYIKNTEGCSKFVGRCGFKTEIVNDYIKVYGPWANRWKIVDSFAAAGIQTYEADLNPVDLFLLDKKVELEEDYRILYIDIETDDRAKKIIVGAEQILSFGWYDNEGNKGWICEDTEIELLKKIVLLLRQYDVIVGWYSSEFDYPYIQARCQKYGINYDWNTIIHIDLHKRFKKLAQYKVDLPDLKLNTVAMYYTGEGKLEYPGSTWEAYQKDRLKLEQYNLRDAELLYILDKATNATKLMILEAKWCSTFLKDFWMGKLIDMFFLKHGHRKGIHFITKPKQVKDGNKSKSKYIGGFVITPVPGLYNNVYIFDFRMTYPNIIRSFNISTETFKTVDDGNCIISPKPGVFFDRKPSLVAQILVELMDKRYEYEKEMKKYELKSKEYEIWRINQDTIKEICNSIYGITGDENSRYYHPDVAASITMGARICLKVISKLWESYNFKVLYGDTDSVFIMDLEPDKKRDIQEILKKVNERLTKTLMVNFRLNESTITLASKDSYIRMMLLRKKGYAGLVLDDKTKNLKDEIIGLESIKADTVHFAKEMQKSILTNLLRNDYPQEYYVNYMKQKKEELYTREFKKEEIIVRKSISKDPNDYAVYSAHAEAAKKMITQGKLVYIGMTIEFIVLSHETKIIPILPEEYTGEFDRRYYWENLILPCNQRILEVVFPYNPEDNKTFDWNTLIDTKIRKSRKKKDENIDKKE